MGIPQAIGGLRLQSSGALVVVEVECPERSPDSSVPISSSLASCKRTPSHPKPECVGPPTVSLYRREFGLGTVDQLPCCMTTDTRALSAPFVEVEVERPVPRHQRTIISPFWLAGSPRTP